MEPVLIKLIADPAGLQPGIDGLVEMEVVDKELGEQVKKTTSEFQKQTKAVEDSTKKSASQLEKLTGSFKNLDKSIAGGAYNKALKSLQREIENTSDEFKQMQIAIGFAKKQMDSLDPNSEEWKELSEWIAAGTQVLEVFGKEEEKVEAKSQSMKARLRELKNELQQLEDQGQENTAQFQALSIEAAKLDDQIGDTNARIAALASDTANIDAAIQGVQALASGFQIAAGATALFGEENEDVQKVLVKLNAIMAITNGLREIQQALQAQSIFRLKVEQVATNLTAAAYRAMGISVTATSSSFKALRAALITTGIGALVVGLGFLVNKLTETSSAADDAEKKLESLNDEFEATEDRLNRVGVALDRVNELNKIDIEIENVGVEGAQTDVQKLQQDIITTLEKLVGLREELKKAQDDFNDADSRQVLNPSDELAKERDAYSEHYEKLKKQVDDAEHFINVNAKNIQLQRAQDAAKALKDQQEREEEAAKKRKEFIEKDNKAKFELQKKAKQDEIDFLNAQANLEGAFFEPRAKALQAALILEKEQIIDQKNFQLENEKLTGNERLLIKQNASDALVAVEVAYGQRLRVIGSNIKELLNQDIQEINNVLTGEAQKLKNSLENIFNSNITGNDVEANVKIKAELALYRQGIINREEYEKRKSAITREHQRKDLEAEIKYQEDLLLIAGITEEERANIERRLYDLKKQLRDRDLEDQEAAVEKSSALDDAAAQRRQKILELAQNTAINLAQVAFNISQKGYQKDEQKIKELYDLKKISETEYQNQLKGLRKKQAQDEKALAVFQVLVNQGPMAVKAFSQGGFPAVAAAFGLFFGLLAAVSSTDVPQFKKGKVRIAGPGTDTSDSIVARISRNESVINASQTKKHEDALRAINEDRFQQYLVQHELPKFYQNMTMPQMPDVVSTTAAEPFNYERMARAFAEEIANNPTTHVSIDENGLQVWTQEQQSITSYKNKKLTL